jgi:hypothetical protein
MFRIPDLSQTPLRGVRVQIDLNFSEYAPEIAAGLKRVFAGKTAERIEGVDDESFSKEHSISVGIAPRSNSLTITIDIHTAFSFEASREEVREVEPTTEDANSISAHEVEHELGERFPVLYGLEGAAFEAVFSFEVDPEQLPSEGIIRSGIGAKARFGDDVLHLAGAKFAINSDPADDIVENAICWFLEFNADTVLGSIEIRGDRDLSPTLLIELTDRAQDQFDRYVLEAKESGAK